MIEAMRILKEKGHKVTVYAVATVREEVGAHGARVASYRISPDLGIALDVTIANDVPGVPEREQVTKLGGGPAIKIMDTSLLVSPTVQQYLIKTAEENKIPYQLEVLTRGGTDAGVIHITKEGVSSGVISIPTRYIHSPIETISLRDVINAAKLTALAVVNLTKDKIEELKGRKIK